MSEYARLLARSLVTGQEVEVPDFATEDAMADFWDSHAFTDESWELLEDVTDSPPPELVSASEAGESLTFEFAPDAVARLRAVSREAGEPWQRLVDRWVRERLDQESGRRSNERQAS